MPEAPRPTIPDLLLRQRGLVFLRTIGAPQSDQLVQGVELELAACGYLLSERLRARLTQCEAGELKAFHGWAPSLLAAHAGGGRKHVPLFRSFPDGVPSDTRALWWSKVLVHFLQGDGQPCLHCGSFGTTHVLDPCRHVVCDRCFDGTSYSACPVCEKAVDCTSPFFKPSAERGQPKERVTFKLLDLGNDLRAETDAWFTALCQRKQALSPTDREVLTAIVRESGERVLAILPSSIPVRENVALVFGSLFQSCPPLAVLPFAARHLRSATDVLRLIAVYSGADASLQPQTIVKQVPHGSRPERFWGRIAALIGKGAGRHSPFIPLRVHRFKVAKLSRALRRALLALLDGMAETALCEDMLRHREWWVWIGEFLHPHEYAKRFPVVASAFQLVRGKDPTGRWAPPFQGWNARLEQVLKARDVPGLLALLSDRPGEFARRFDLVLRLAGHDAALTAAVLDAFRARVRAFATPVLLTLRAHLPTRATAAAVRVYWPKGSVALGPSEPDRRVRLGSATIASAVAIIDAELLARFAGKQHLAHAVIDAALRSVVVPFNERTASPAAVSLPRGSRVALEPGKLLRFFLHWCQPERVDNPSDLDLSVAFYDVDWKHVGVCSYYQLECRDGRGPVMARSAGDLRDAPWPDGATEFVDLHVDVAAAAGVRYAVMVVNNYNGMPFSQLARGFAGVMTRDDQHGQHFDPRTVALRFNITGENGVFMPVVIDLQQGVLHWLDVQAKGSLNFNNVATSNSAIASICPALMSYFASGARPSLFDLGVLHAAARCHSLQIRGEGGGTFVRRAGESSADFHARILRGDVDTGTIIVSDHPHLALLFRGDIDPPAGSAVYALFRERVVPTMAASDLLS